jgi:hypothetical protein
LTTQDPAVTLPVSGAGTRAKPFTVELEDGLGLEDGLALVLGLADGLVLADGLALADGLVLADGLGIDSDWLVELPTGSNPEPEQPRIKDKKMIAAKNLFCRCRRFFVNGSPNTCIEGNSNALYQND